MIALGLWLSRLSDKEQGTQDYFLASKSLPWWAVGGSLIASNISAEQFIGMSGSGYVVGMAIASYELMAAITLIIVAKYFLPIFLKKGIYTMPQFLESRYDGRVKSVMAVFWVLLFVFVNITSVMYLGALSIQTILGVPMIYGIIGLAIYSASFSIFGGLKAVVWTDVVQVVVLIFGGLVTTYLVMTAMEGSFLGGLSALVEKAPEKFDMILDKGHAEYKNLPGLGVLIGGMWIANIYYWGNNQYIIQRALGAKSLAEAQKGTIFAAAMKIILPIIVVVPGIAAFVLQADIAKADQAYPWVLSNYVTSGFKGLAFAALVAAIGSSISSMVNSTSTIFTLDIYKSMIKKNDATEKHLVRVGKIASAIAIAIGCLVAPALGALDQAFQYIQEYTGFISPGVVAVFLFGFFWKKTSANAALIVVLLSIPLSITMKLLAPEFPFIHRMGVTFLICSFLLIVISYMGNKQLDDDKAIEIESGLFKTDMLFNIGSVVVIGVIAAIYAMWW
ncbi:UNVERIFIED_CONTAM: hypothetical protein GTU68_024169 [Idotea baltica]|nr:hypothetical protein [Idotea baltica]